jgi:hypothetical protein
VKVKIPVLVKAWEMHTIETVIPEECMGELVSTIKSGAFKLVNSEFIDTIDHISYDFDELEILKLEHIKEEE